MRTEIVVSDDREGELARSSAAIAVEARQYTIIRNDAHRDQALEFATRVKRLRAIVAELYEEPIAQAHKLHKTLCVKRTALAAPLDDADNIVRRSVGAHEAAKREAAERKRQAAIAEALRQQEAADAERTRTDWRFEIVNPDALPREFLMPDDKKIGAIVRVSEGETNIPGVRVWLETMTSVR